MKLRTKKRFINASSLVLVLGAAVTVVLAWRSEPPQVQLEKPRVQTTTAKSTVTESMAPGAKSPSWQFVLRRPLYDPPPPPPPQVVVQQRPITVQLVGTVIEPNNSQAFVRQASGIVELKRIGDQVTSDAVDGVIGQITVNEIVIRREDGEHHVSVKGPN